MHAVTNGAQGFKRYRNLSTERQRDSVYVMDDGETTAVTRVPGRLNFQCQAFSVTTLTASF